MSINSIADIVADIRAGKMVSLVDEQNRENEGDLVFAAEFVTPDKINFMARFGRGLICMPITESHAKRLNLPPMVAQNRSVHGTNFTVSRVAAPPQAVPDDTVPPGHVFPLIAQTGGVLVRAGHTEACCDLAGLAGLY